MSTAEQRKKWREKWKKQYDKIKSDPEKLKAHSQKVHKNKMERDPEGMREYEREKKREQRKVRSDEINAVQRACYARDSDGAIKQNSRRHKREPHRLVRATIRDFHKGVFGVDECLERIDQAVAQSDKILTERTGKPGRPKN